MGLFGRSRPQSNAPRIEQYAQTVEAILANLGIDPAQARMSMTDGFGWSFRRGSALIEIYVTQKDNIGYLQVLSPILHLPMTGLLPLYRRLLELNLQLTEAGIGVYLDAVFIFIERPLEGMDAAEADQIINNVAAYADELDDKLVSEFGGRLYGRI
ncbi:MAG: YbjN domain-containing protein [bacterium]|nr:YbjN domain-containing protein [bacterium]